MIFQVFYCKITSTKTTIDESQHR